MATYKVQLPNDATLDITANNQQEANQQADQRVAQSIQRKQKDGRLASELLAEDELFLNKARAYYKGKDPSSVKEEWFNDDHLLVREFVNDMRWRDNNSVSMAKSLSYVYGGISDEQKKLTAYMYNTWDALPGLFETGGEGFKGLISNIGKGLADPLNFVGGPLLAVGKSFAIKKGAQVAIKNAVNKSASRKIVQASLIGGGADSAISAGFSLADQAERVDIGMQDSINYDQVFGSAALGAVSGFGFNAVTMGAGRLKPVRAVTESELVKKSVQKASLLSSQYLTSHGGAGHRILEFGQRFMGALKGENQQIREKGNLFKNELETYYKQGEVTKSYDELIQDPTRADEINSIFQSLLDDTSDLNVSVEPRIKKGTQSEMFPLESLRDPEVSETVPKQKQQASKASDDQMDMFPDDYDQLDFTVQKTDTETRVTPNVGKEILAANPNLRKAGEDFINVNSKLRQRIIDGNIISDELKSIFSARGNGHLTRAYKAFLDPMGNLRRIKALRDASPGSEENIKYQRAANYVADHINKTFTEDGISKRVSADSIEVDSLINLIAEGRLQETRKYARELGDSSLIKELDDYINEKPQFDGTHAEVVETLQEGFRVAGNDKIAPALTKRDSIPPALRDILGVSDDPIERLIQTNNNLSSLYWYSDFTNKVSFELMRTGQIDRALTSGDQAIKTKTIGEMINREELDGLNLGLDYSTIKDKTIVDAVRDGDIKNTDSLDLVLKVNDDVADIAYKNIGEGSVYNPLGQMMLTKEFKQSLDQVMHGARFNRDGAIINIGTAVNRVNMVANMAKTVYSPVTVARNFIGGLVQFLAVTGGAGFNFRYLGKTYFPMWREITKSMQKGESVADISLRLKKKGRTTEEIDEIMEDILELYSSNVLDVDFIAESSRTFGRQADDPINKGIDKIYNNKGFNIRGVDQFFRRSYATGDEVFKALYFNQRKKFYQKAGFTKTEAIDNASFDVRRHLPNYRIQPKLIKAARATGLGTFTAFTTEITRNTKNIFVDSFETFNRGSRLIREGNAKQGRALQIDASKRLATILGVTAAGAGAIEAMTFDKEDDELNKALLKSMANWDQKSQFVILAKDKENANSTYIDVSYMNPFTPLVRTLPAIMRIANQRLGEGKTVDEAYTEGFAYAMGEFFSPYLSPGLGAGPIMNMMLGTLNEDTKQKEKGFNALIKNMTPGIATEISRFYDTVTGEIEKPYNIGPQENVEETALGSVMGGKIGEGRRQVWNLAGVAVKKHNFQFGQEKIYRNLKNNMMTAQRNFTSYLSRTGLGKKYNEEFFNKEDVEAILGLVSGVDPRRVRTVSQANQFVNSYAEANRDRFLAQREIYVAMLRHKRVLMSLDPYQGKNGNAKMFKEIFRLSTKAGLSKTVARQFARSAAYDNPPPKYKPFKISSASLKNLRTKMLDQKITPDQQKEIEAILIDGTDAVSKQLKGISLGISISD